MMHLEWVSPIIDIGLLVSLCLFGLRMVRSSGPRVNLGRLAELESSLRGLLKEAESAGRQLNDQLLKRQRDIEKSLIDASSAEGQLNRAVSAAEERRGMLEVITGRADALLKAMDGRSAAGAFSSSGQSPSAGVRESSEKATNLPILAPAMVSSSAAEPPSFEMVMASRGAPAPTRRRRLSEQVEREVSVLEPMVATPPPVTPTRAAHEHRPDGNSSSEIRQRARELQRNLLLNKEAPEEEPRRSSVLPPEEAATATREDPRLGALSRGQGQEPIRRQTQVL